MASEVALGKRPQLKIFGQDYKTPDGTCIRDYIHVEDLADIHVLALQYLEQNGDSILLNCGYGQGHSVLEVAEAMRRVSQHPFKMVFEGPRAGDAAILVADSSHLRRVLDWKPRYNDLDLICRTALLWEAQSLVNTSEEENLSLDSATNR